MAIKQVIIIASLALMAAGLPSGPPESICADPNLKPAGHPGDFQQGPSNYQLSIKPLNQEAGIYRVTLETKDEKDTFKGFVLQAQAGGQPVGNFVFTKDADDFKMFACQGNEVVDTVSHVNAKPKMAVNAVWLKPEGVGAGVTFKATVVKNYQTYWSLSKSANF